MVGNDLAQRGGFVEQHTYRYGYGIDF